MPFTLDDKYLDSAEQQLGARLPASYRRSMMAANGGEIAGKLEDWYLYPIRDDSDKKRLARSCHDALT
ncbi:MAG: SMI1/KNR4 family protein, partial [Oxalobacteraceae bacterium]